MACFPPKNNAYCIPNVNAFLDTKNPKLNLEFIIIHSVVIALVTLYEKTDRHKNTILRNNKLADNM